MLLMKQGTNMDLNKNFMLKHHFYLTLGLVFLFLGSSQIDMVNNFWIATFAFGAVFFFVCFFLEGNRAEGNLCF